jgi:hypothetical protein
MTEAVSILTVKVITGAKHTEMVGWMEDGSLKVRLHAKPIEGKANRELLGFLAEQFKVPKESIEIIQGEHAKRKVLKFDKLLKTELEKIVAQSKLSQEP